MPTNLPSRQPQQHLDRTAAGTDNIAVCVRLRPLSQREEGRGDIPVWNIDDDGSVSFTQPNSNVPSYGFQTVYSKDHSNYHVYQQTGGPIIQSVISGVNGTVFAYGVTSSGKTHTMLGHATQPGLVPQAVQHLFKLIEQTPSRVFLLRLSMLEIYNEVINDLLEPANANLRLREDGHRGGFYVEGIKEVEVRRRLPFCF